jgi:hypothetical protein
MKITKDEHEMFFKWWVTWETNNFISELGAKDKRVSKAINEMQEFIRVHSYNCLLKSRVGGLSGFGFREEIEAIHFYMTFCHHEVFQ